MKIGHPVTLFCRDWIYAGKVIAVHDNYVVLDPCWMIFDYGQWSNTEWKTYERIPTAWCVQKSVVESWGVGKALPLEGDIAPRQVKTAIRAQLSDHIIGIRLGDGTDE